MIDLLASLGILLTLASGVGLLLIATALWLLATHCWGRLRLALWRRRWRQVSRLQHRVQSRG